MNGLSQYSNPPLIAHMKMRGPAMESWGACTVHAKLQYH